MTRDTRTPVERGITKIISARTGRVSWECRWSTADASGRRVYGYKRCRTLKDARAERARRTTEIREGTYQPASRETVAEYAARWLDRMARTKWATSTAYTRRAQYARYLADELGGARLAALTRADCQRVIDAMIAAGKAPNTVITVAALMSGLFHAAELDGIVARNPARGLMLPTVRPAPVTVWTGAQVETFLAVTAAEPEAPLWRLLLTTGLRIGEALALRWADVDLAGGVATIQATMRKQADGSDAPAHGTKTGERRDVPLLPATVAALEAHKETQAAMRRGAKVWDVRGFVFADGAGLPWSYSVIVKRWGAAVAAAALPRITLHGARHCFTSRLIASGADARTVADLLGHRRLTMTLEVYAHSDMASRRGAVEALGVEIVQKSAATGEKSPSS